MELKQEMFDYTGYENQLLIVPYGIETRVRKGTLKND